MSMTTLERAVLAEAKTVFNNPKLRLKDMAEWSTAEMDAIPGEVIAQLPSLGVYVAIKIEHDKRRKT